MEAHQRFYDRIENSLGALKTKLIPAQTPIDANRLVETLNRWLADFIGSMQYADAEISEIAAESDDAPRLN